MKCKECGYAVKANGINHKTGRVSLSCYGRATLKSCDISFKGVRLADLQNKVGNEIQKKLDEIAIVFQISDGRSSCPFSLCRAIQRS